MHLSCENTDTPCPVILPDTCPPPRCDCQEDRSRARHCGLCHLPFDIEERLQPHSGLRVFCSCFLGESRVLLRYPMVFWMPVVYVPNLETPEVDSGRSSFSTGYTHSVTPTTDARLSSDSSSNHSPGEASAESDHCLPKETIEDSSVEYGNSLPKHCFVGSIESNHDSPNSTVLDTLEESTCTPLPQDDKVSNKNDLTSLSEEVIQFKDSDSPNTLSDEVNQTEGTITETEHIEISTAVSSSLTESPDFASSCSGVDGLCKNESSNTPVFGGVNNLKASDDISYTSFENTPELVDRTLLVQVSEEESTSYANVTEPFTTVEDGTFSSKPSPIYQTSDPMREETPSDKLYANTNYLNSSVFNAGSLGNGFQLNASAKSFQSPAPSNVPYSKNDVENKCKFAKSYYSSDIWNMSGSNANSLTKNPLPTPSHHNFAHLNTIENNRNYANVHNCGKFGIPSNSQVAQEHHPLRYPNVETPEQHSSRSEINSQHQAVNVSSTSEFAGQLTLPSGFAQSNRMTSSHQPRWCAGNSSVPPGFQPHCHTASSNAGVLRQGSGIDSRSSAGNRGGFVEGSDLIQEIIRVNRGTNLSLQDLVQHFEGNSKKNNG